MGDFRFPSCKAEAENRCKILCPISIVFYFSANQMQTRFLCSQSGAKPKPNATARAGFSRAWHPLHVFASRSDWFNAFVLIDKMTLLSIKWLLRLYCGVNWTSRYTLVVDCTLYFYFLTYRTCSPLLKSWLSLVALRSLAATVSWVASQPAGELVTRLYSSPPLYQWLTESGSKLLWILERSDVAIC